ncbi:hypothetical protein FXO38_33899 [Capsicum annuum]|nr:hypothetical protein FXO38_33899 [Capsicum annuum]
MFTAPGGDAFIKSTRDNDEEQELIWDAIERLPTYDRLRKGILRQTLDDGKINYHENASINLVEGFLEKIKIVPSKKRIVNILRHVNGIVRPSRMTLLLGPPGFGKTTLLKTFVGVLDKDPRVNGRISYCGRELSDFTPQKTCAYISQHDIHHGEMITFRETLDFAGRCLAVGKRRSLTIHWLHFVRVAMSVGRSRTEPLLPPFIEAAISSNSISFLAILVLSLVMGIVLNYTMFLCTIVNSALTTTVVRVLKGVESTTLGFVMLGGVEVHALNATRMVINTTGGVWYLVAKYQEKKRKLP